MSEQLHSLMCNIRAAFGSREGCSSKKLLWRRAGVWAVHSPSVSEEPFGRDAEMLLGWSDTCCWSWTGLWWQSTSCWHSQQEEGMHSAPIGINPRWKANRQDVDGKEPKREQTETRDGQNVEMQRFIGNTGSIGMYVECGWREKRNRESKADW